MRYSQKNPKVSRHSDKRNNRLSYWVVLAILLIVGLALWFIYPAPPEESVEVEKKHRTLVRVAKPATNKNSVAQHPVIAADTPQSEEQFIKEEPAPLTPEEIEAEERRKDPLYDRHHIVAKMPLVKEPIEQLMLTVFTTELGDMPPMLPAIPAFDEERFEKLVNLKTLPDEGDSKEALLSKDLVNEVKAELAKYIREGGTTSGFLSYYVNELDLAFHERETCKELVMKAMKTDDPETAREIFKTFNERLKSKGIKQLTLTRRQKEYLGIQEND